MNRRRSRLNSTTSTGNRPAGRGSTRTLSVDSSRLGDDRESDFVFEENVVGGRIPKQYIPSIERGFRDCLAKGPLAEFPVVGLKVVLEDGSYHEVDSSDKAFQICAQGCFRETFPKTKPVLLEPVMKLDIESPEKLPRCYRG